MDSFDWRIVRLQAQVLDEAQIIKPTSLDACRVTRPSYPALPVRWDFGEFFVVKESLALMYKELQLPSEALLKYQASIMGSLWM